ncbi:hypothetical protein PMAYCL1PPCAC_23250, partial [Pristionchus mayeri]
ELSPNDFVDELIDRFDSEINEISIASRSSLREEEDRFSFSILRCFDKNLPNFEVITIGFSRKIELELVNFYDTARALSKCMREQLIYKLSDYDDDLIDQFTDRSTVIINDEGEALREELRRRFIELLEEKEKRIARCTREYDEMVRANGDKRRQISTAEVNPPLENIEKSEKKTIRNEIEIKKEELDQLLDKISTMFTQFLTTRTEFSKDLIDHSIQKKIPVFGTILSTFNDEVHLVYKNHRSLINISAEQILDQFTQQSDDFEFFPVVGLSLQQKTKEFFQRMEGQITSATRELDKYRIEERREVIAHHSSTQSNLDGVTYAVDEGGEVLYDGRIRRRETGTEIRLEGVQLETDEDGRISCELHKRVLLKRIEEENEEIQIFAVQRYSHANLLRCIGAGFHNEIRYLVFDYFSDTLSSLLHVNPRGLSQHNFIQFSNGLQQALQCIHEKNYYHGDIRPENVYFSPSDDDDHDTVKLAHFSSMSAREMVEWGRAEESPFSSPEAGKESSLLLLQRVMQII